jgi:hypothetical protein
MLIIHLPSTLHETGIESLTSPFNRARYELEDRDDRLVDRWRILFGKKNQYGDLSSHGSYIADASLDVDGVTVLLFEIGFSQSWRDLISKANRILNSGESVLGVVVMNIMEHPKWGNPNRHSKPDDFIGDKKRWNEIVWESQKEQPFGPIIVSGHIWMQTINVDLCLIKKP